MTLDVALLTAPSPPDEVTGGHRYNGELAFRAARHGARMRSLTIAGSTFPGRVAAARRALRAAAGADVIVVDSIVAATLALAGDASRPTVALVHQLPEYGAGSAFGRLTASLARATYRRCELAIAVSAWVAGQLDALHVPSAVVEPGVDPAHTRPVSRGRDVADILCVANWLPAKGIVALAEAMARVPDGPAHLQLVGATHLETRYGRGVARRLARADLHDRVRVRGTLRGDDLADAFAAADLFALPAAGEAFGIAFAEALSFGLPIVACRSGNVPALVGDAAVLVERGDTEGLAWALSLLVADRDRRREMSEISRERARALHSWEETASAFFSALSSGTRSARASARDERDREASSA